MQIEVKDIYIRPGYTSMRKGINGLVDTVLGGMDMDPLSGDLFVFCGRNRHSLKMLYWSGDSFWLLQKTNIRITFAWPNSELEVLNISENELSMLLEGINCWRSNPVLDAAKRVRKCS